MKNLKEYNENHDENGRFASGGSGGGGSSSGGDSSGIKSGSGKVLSVGNKVKDFNGNKGTVERFNKHGQVFMKVSSSPNGLAKGSVEGPYHPEKIFHESLGEPTMKIEEMIKKEGEKFVIYSEDGKKVLGKFDTKPEAEKRLKQIEMFKNKGSKESMAPGLALIVGGGVEIIEGGSYLLVEEDMARLKDKELQDYRKLFIEKRQVLRQAMNDLAPEQRYSSPEGSQYFDDLCYYGNLISRIECEMSCRMLTLD